MISQKGVRGWELFVGKNVNELKNNDVIQKGVKDHRGTP